MENMEYGEGSSMDIADLFWKYTKDPCGVQSIDSSRIDMACMATYAPKFPVCPAETPAN
jgi:hypothetical protein